MLAVTENKWSHVKDREPASAPGVKLGVSSNWRGGDLFDLDIYRLDGPREVMTITMDRQTMERIPAYISAFFAAVDAADARDEQEKSWRIA